ncbi:MAG: hypothetical protein ACYC0F_04195 [Rhodanobacter sp.]
MKTIFRIAALLAYLIACSSAVAKEGKPLGQSGFHICAKPIPGVTYDVSTGLDADSGSAKSKYGVVRILIGGPSAFFDNPSVFIEPPSRPDVGPGKKIVVPKMLAKSLSLIGKSADTDKPNTVALYGYSRGNVASASPQDLVLVLLKAGGGKVNLELQNKVGRALYRCH